MSKQGKPSQSPASVANRVSDESQLDFEIDFFSSILLRHPDYLDVLRVHGNNLTLQGRYEEGLKIDRRLTRLRPQDALAHYNLACSLALLHKPESAFKALRRSMELGYRDFRYMLEDGDLDVLRKDPRFRQLLREFQRPK